MTSTHTMGRDGATLGVRGWDGTSLGARTLGGADPLGFAAGDANLYRYVGNDPTNATDPTGLEEQHFSGPYGPRWNDEKNIAEVYFMIDYTPSWYNYIQPWWSYSPTPSTEKAFPIPTLSKQECTPNGLKNLDNAIRASMDLQIAYATGIRNALTTGYNNSTVTAEGLGMAAVGMVAAGSVRFFRNMSRADCHMNLRNSGFDYQSTSKGGYVRYKHPDGSEVYLRPNGEVVRLGPKVTPSGGGKPYAPRVDSSGNRIDTHSTGEYVSSLPGYK